VEILIAIIGALGAIGAASLAATLPVVLRRARGAVEAEGAVTREAMTEAVTALGTQVNARVTDVRDDIDDIRENVARVREDVARIREWQAGHDAEHLLIGRRPDTQGD
jgi:hypothetical protein